MPVTDHSHRCPHRLCQRRYWCALDGCKDWSFRCCDSCWQKIHKGGTVTVESDTAKVVKDGE